MKLCLIVVLTLTFYSNAVRIEKHQLIPEISKSPGDPPTSRGEYLDKLEAGLPQDMLDRLWMGEDVVPELFSSDADQVAAMQAQTHSPRLVVLGPMDAGTHLLMAFLRKNVPDFETKCRPLSAGCAALWKHSSGKEGIYDTLAGDLENVEAVLIVRSPLSQVHSWRKSPWDMEFCVTRPYEKYGTQCSARLDATPAKDHIGITHAVPEILYNSTMDVYNKYMETYKGLLQDGILKAVHMVSYEDLVYTPEEALRQIGKTMGWELPEHIKIIGKSAKGKKDHGREEALQKLKRRSYLSDVAPAKEILCSDLDRALIKDVTEGTYTNEAKNYAFDCDSTDGVSLH